MLLECSIGRRDHARVDANRGGAADGLDLAVLQRAEELGLQVDRQLADLVEKQRAAIGRDEQAAFGGVGTGERATDVTEQLAVEQGADERSAVDGDESTAGALPREVKPC